MSEEVQVPSTHEPVVPEGVSPVTGSVVDENAFLNGSEAPQETPPATEDTTGFDPSNIDFGLQSYNLERFNFNEEVMTSIQPSLDRFSEAKLTQAQLDIVMDEIVGTGVTPEDTTQVLEKTLTHDEKRNYSNITRFAKEVYGGTDIDPVELMKDPYAVKILNIAFSKTKGKPTQTLTTNEPAVQNNNVESAESNMKFKSILKKANVSKETRNGQIEALIKENGNAAWAQEKYGKSIIK